jgi:hypothetical protein
MQTAASLVRLASSAALAAAVALAGPSTVAARTAAAQAPPSDTAAVGAQLRARAQRMMDAVALGDTTAWAPHLSPVLLFTDENGETISRAALLESMRPLPPGYSGQIRVANAQVRVVGQTAVMTYDAMEDETIYGQHLATRYHTTDSYAWSGGRWLMVASQTSVIPSEHTAVAATARLDDYAGRYELAPGATYTVTVEDGRLFGRRGDRPREEMLPLGTDRFFRRGAVRGERVFTRDAQGRVTAMVDRRDNNDLVWRRGP